MFKGFRDFILRGNVIDLAVAVIIGAAFTAIVTSLTEKIINPLLGAVIGKPNFGYLVGHINGGEVRYGDFLTAIVNFLLIAAVVYFFLVIPTQYLLKKFNRPPPSRHQPLSPARSALAISPSQQPAASSAPSPSNSVHKNNEPGECSSSPGSFLTADHAPIRLRSRLGRNPVNNPIAGR